MAVIRPNTIVVADLRRPQRLVRCPVRSCAQRHGPPHEHCFGCSRVLPADAASDPLGARKGHCSPYPDDMLEIGSLQDVPRDEVGCEADLPAPRPGPHRSMLRLEAFA